MCFPNICILWAIALNKKVDLVRQRGYIRIRQRCVFVRSGFGVVGFLFLFFFVFCMPASIVTGCRGIMDILDEKVKGPHDFLCLYTVCQLCMEARFRH